MTKSVRSTHNKQARVLKDFRQCVVAPAYQKTVSCERPRLRWFLHWGTCSSKMGQYKHVRLRRRDRPHRVLLSMNLMFFFVTDESLRLELSPLFWESRLRRARLGLAPSTIVEPNDFLRSCKKLR